MCEKSNNINKGTKDKDTWIQLKSYFAPPREVQFSKTSSKELDFSEPILYCCKRNKKLGV